MCKGRVPKETKTHHISINHGSYTKLRELHDSFVERMGGVELPLSLTIDQVVQAGLSSMKSRKVISFPLAPVCPKK